MTGAQSNGWQCCDNTAAERRRCDGRKHSLRRIEAEFAGILYYRGKQTNTARLPLGKRAAGGTPLYLLTSLISAAGKLERIAGYELCLRPKK